MGQEQNQGEPQVANPQAASGDVGDLPPAPAAVPTPAAVPVSDPVADPKMVPLAALEDERRKRQQYEQMVNQILMQQTRVPQAPAPQDDVLSRLGVKPEDLYDENGLRRFTVGINNLIQQQVQQGISQFGTQQFLAEHPDFAGVVGQSYGGQFVPSPTFQAACAQDPYLQAAVNGLLASGDTLGAMRLAYDRASKAARPPQTVNPSIQIPGVTQQVQRQVAPTSPMSVGGGGAFAAAGAVGRMSDEEFARLDAQAAGTPGV